MIALYSYLIKILAAILCGGLVGLEREKAQKSAGLRTCILVTMASTMVMLFSTIMKEQGAAMDASRVPAYMLSSIGFLGAGIIMAKDNKIEGITTAAILLVLIPTGLLIGIGEFPLAIICSVITFLVLKLKYVEIKFKLKKPKKGARCSTKKES